MDIDGDGRLTGKEVILGISNENTFRKSQVNRFKQAHRSEEDTVLIEVRILYRGRGVFFKETNIIPPEV